MNSSNTSTTNSTPSTSKATGTTGTTVDFTEDVTSKQQEDDDLIYIVMAAVGGFVLLIIVTVIIAFVIKSRHRRNQNLRRYHERQQRPPTLSLEVIDREDYTRESINGVNHALYGQDPILPITLSGNQSHQDQNDLTSVPPSETSPLQGNQPREESITPDATVSKQQDENNQGNGVIGSIQQQGDSATSIPVYENTIVSQQKSLPVCTQMKVNTSEMLQKRTKSEKDHSETKNDYETAFPVLDDHSKNDYENINTANTTASTDSVQSTNVENINDLTDKKDTVAVTVNTDQMKNENSDENGNVAKSKRDKPKPKVKPKPTTREKTCDDKSESECKTIASGDNKEESNDYENSLAKLNFQQAQLLKSVPPPCNTHPYINVPNNEHMLSDSEIVLQRQSSEYEDPENVLSLHKHAQFKFKADMLKDRGSEKKTILSNSDASQRSESKSRLIESKDKTDKTRGKKKMAEPKTFKSEQGQSKAEQAEQRPEYANINVQNQPDSKHQDSRSYDYENEDDVKELKLNLKRLGRRGFSTSSLETFKQDRYLQAHLTKKKDQAGSELSTENDVEYLQMDAVGNDDGEYLPMDTVNDDEYMSMVTPESDAYMQMERNYNLPMSVESRTLQPRKVKNLNLPKGNLTVPKPCGGIQNTGYVNFSDQPSTYVNFFRSRSTDSVYSYAGMKSKDFQF